MVDYSTKKAVDEYTKARDAAKKAIQEWEETAATPSSDVTVEAAASVESLHDHLSVDAETQADLQVDGTTYIEELQREYERLRDLAVKEYENTPTTETDATVEASASVQSLHDHVEVEAEAEVTPKTHIQMA